MSLNIGMIQGKRTCKMKKERLINRYKVLTLEEEDHWDYRGKTIVRGILFTDLYISCNDGA